jgi:alpha-tubulin suppressor-like RCC1 family protein
VVTWGRGEDGQLGHGDAESQHLPMVVQSLEGEECDEIICGAEYTIAVSHSKQKIWSWGWGDFGRLGHGNPFDLFLPKQISSLCNIKIKLVACGDSHTMVVTGAGEVFSFGRNQNGQLGLGSRIDCMIPTKIVELGAHKVESVGCGAEHTAACTEGGKVFSWGWGLYGNLGLGDNQDRLVPTEVSTFTQNKTHVKTVACGWRHTCAVSDKGELFTFGWSKYGQLGHGDNETSDIPKKVAAVEGATVTQVSGGWRHTMALDSDGKVYACGWNQYGQVGNGNSDDVNTIVQVKALDGEFATMIRCGWRHSLAVTKSGKLFTWGRGVHGQLGHQESKDSNLPKELEKKSVVEAAQLKPQTQNFISAADRYATVPENPTAGQDGVSNKKQKVGE